VVQEVIYRLFSEVCFGCMIVHGDWFVLAGKKDLGWKNWIEAMPLKVQRIETLLAASSLGPGFLSYCGCLEGTRYQRHFHEL